VGTSIRLLPVPKVDRRATGELSPPAVQDAGWSTAAARRPRDQPQAGALAANIRAPERVTPKREREKIPVPGSAPAGAREAARRGAAKPRAERPGRALYE